MIAEESTAFPAVSRPTWVGGLGFTYKWNMGWMHDILTYVSKDPVYRRWEHQHLTFSMLYAWNENFILPFSHDEVVHGKGSMIDEDSGRRVAEGGHAARALRVHVRASRARSCCSWAASSASGASGTTTRRSTGICWSEPLHAGLQRFVEDLNRALRARAGAARGRLRAAGLRVDRLQRPRVERDLADPPRARAATTGSSWCSTGRRSCATSYRIGVPEPGYYRELLNSDASAYGGSNVGNEGGRAAEPVPAHGHAQSLVLTIPPLGVLFLKRDVPVESASSLASP